MTLADFRTKNSSSYENFLRTIKGICEDASQVEEGLRRCVFNIVMRNEDDHTKNFSFLMDQTGKWILAPAYDLTYVRIPDGSGHQMSINGKNLKFSKEDVIALGKHSDVKAAKVLQIISEVEEAAGKFFDYADEVDLPRDFAEGVERNFKRLL